MQIQICCLYYYKKLTFYTLLAITKGKLLLQASDTIPNTRDVIDAKRATLMSTICPDCMFEAHLIQRHVMSDPQIKSLEVFLFG